MEPFKPQASGQAMVRLVGLCTMYPPPHFQHHLRTSLVVVAGAGTDFRSFFVGPSLFRISGLIWMKFMPYGYRSCDLIASPFRRLTDADPENWLS